MRRLHDLLNAAYAEEGGSEDPDRDVMPSAGCGDSTVVELEENLAVLLLDSQWWIQDAANDPTANSGCEVKNQGRFALLLADHLISNRTRKLFVASHHPIRSQSPWLACR